MVEEKLQITKTLFQLTKDLAQDKITVEDVKTSLLQLLDLIHVTHSSFVKHPIGIDGKENKKSTYCYQCGTNVKNQKFCHGCGRKLIWTNI